MGKGARGKIEMSGPAVCLISNYAIFKIVCRLIVSFNGRENSATREAVTSGFTYN